MTFFQSASKPGLFPRKQLERSAQTTGEDIYPALACFAGHCHDELLLVAKKELGEAHPRRLTATLAPNNREVYVMVTGEGMLICGCADDLSTSTTLQMGQFDANWHESVSATLSRHHRPVGDALDLWIVVRRWLPPQEGEGNSTTSITWAEPDVVAYHGIIHVPDHGSPLLRAAHDDLEKSSSWAPLSAQRLPDAITAVCLCPAFGRDPLAPHPDFAQLQQAHMPPDLKAKLDLSLQVSPILAWSPGLVFYDTGANELEGRDLHTGDTQSLKLSDWIRCICLDDRQRDEQGRPIIRGVVGCNDGLILGFEWREGRLGIQWLQNMDDVPMSITFSGPCDRKTGWPELLIATRLSGLLKVQPRQSEAIQDGWDSLWKRCFPTAAQALTDLERGGPHSWVEPLLNDHPDPQVQRAAVLGVLDYLPKDKELTSTELAEGWRGVLGALFTQGAAQPWAAAAMQILLKKFRQWAGCDRLEQAKLNNGRYLLPSFLEEIYDALPLTLKEKIDREVRSVPEGSPMGCEAQLGSLTARALRNRFDIWCVQDGSGAAELAHRAALGLDLWADAFIPTDARYFGAKEQRPSQVWTAVLGPHGSDADASTVVAVATGLTLAIYPVTPTGKLSNRPLGPVISLLSSTAALHAMTAGSSQLLVHAGRRGRIQVYRLGPEGLVLTHEEIPAEASRSRVWCLASGPADGDERLLVAGFRMGYRSFLRRFLVDETGALSGATEALLDLPRVRTIAIARLKTGGYWLLAGANHGAPADLYHLTSEGNLATRPIRRTLTGRVVAVGFDEEEEPSRCFITSREGMVWAMDISPWGHLHRLCWTYQSDAPVYGLCPITLDHSRYVLLCAQNGRLILLSAADGARRWQHDFGMPNRALSVGGPDDAPVMAIGARRGWLHLMVPSTQPEEAWAKALKDIQTLSAEGKTAPPPARHTHPFVSVEAMVQWQRGQKPRDILTTVAATDGDARMRLLRRISQTDELLSDEARIKGIIGVLSPDDLVALIAYWPREHAGASPAIFQRLVALAEPGSWQQVNHRSAFRAMATYLQLLGGGHPSRETMLKYLPPDPYLSSRWVRMVCSRLVMEHIASSHTTESQQRFRLLLPFIMRMPPSIVLDLAAYQSEGSPLSRLLVQVSAVLTALAEHRPTPEEDVQALADSLEAYRGQSTLEGLLASLAAFHCAVKEAKAQGWGRQRQRCLSLLGALGQVKPPMGSLTPAVKAFARQVCTWPMSEALPPDDSLPVAQRQAWALKALTRLKRDATPAAPPSSKDPWRKIHHRLLRHSESLVRWCLEQEFEHVQSLVRPLLKVQRVERNPGGKVDLVVTCWPDGERIMHDVTVTFQALRTHSNPDGLRKPGKVSWKRDFIAYPGPHCRAQVKLSGLVDHEQTRVSIKVRWQSREEAERVVTWSFPIPPAQDPEDTAGSWLEHLPAWKKAFVSLLKEQRAGLVIVLASSPQACFPLATWLCGELQARHIELDRVLKTWGKGRSQAYRGLTKESITSALVQDEASQPGGRRRADWTVYSPAVETAERFLAGEAAEAFRAWFTELNHEHSKPKRGRHVMILPWAQGARLRRKLGVTLVELPSYTRPEPLEEVAGNSKVSAVMLQELRQLLEHDLAITKRQSNSLVQRLGTDLRLHHQFVNHIKALPDPRYTPKEVETFLEEGGGLKLLREELALTSPLELWLLVLGSMAVTRLKLDKLGSEHVAAERVVSNPRTHAPKTLIAVGQHFDNNIINRIRSGPAMRTPRATEFAVQGFGAQHAFWADGTLAHQLWRAIPAAALTQALNRLNRLGNLKEAGGLYRTVGPLRTYIRKTYDSLRELEPGQRDRRFISQSLGKSRSALDWLPFSSVGQLTPQVLKQLTYDLGQEVDSIIHLSRVWATPAPASQVLPILARIFSDDGIHLLRVNPNKVWHRPLLDFDGVATFGIGHLGENEGYREYLMWVPATHDLAPHMVHSALRRMAQLVEQQRKSKHAKGKDWGELLKAWKQPLVLLTGPGVDTWQADASRQLAVLKATHLLEALTMECAFPTALRRLARPQLSLVTLSPFQISGALPPGSKLFVGREKELKFIFSRLGRRSILIVGGRAIGKTSILNQVRGHIRNTPNFREILIEGQGLRNDQLFVNRLAAATENTSLKQMDVKAALDEVVRQTEADGKMPIFLINEVDGLAQAGRRSASLDALRGLNDMGKARCIMVGYSALLSVRDVQSPFFHFTEGMDEGLGGEFSKVIFLKQLDKEPAERLLAPLTEAPLLLQWNSEEERQEATDLMLKRSYKIPWALQHMAHYLVERAEGQRRDILYLDDVKYVLERHGDVIAHYIKRLDFSQFGGDSKDPRNETGLRLVLTCTLRRHYMLGESPAIHEPLHFLNPTDSRFAFTAEDAREIVVDTLKDLLLESELIHARRWLHEFDLDRAFTLLTLALILEPSPNDIRAFGFMLHMFPIELHRVYHHDDPQLDGQVVELATRFMRVSEIRDKTTL